jgi:hypothetical protein
MSGTPQQVGFDLSSAGFAGAKASTLLTTSNSQGGALDHITIEPFGVYIAKLSK